MDELGALTSSQREYRECSIMCFTETWFRNRFRTPTAPSAADCRSSGKRRGGGIAVLVSNRWCNPGHVTVKERLCSPDIELLAVSLRPYYLPREFSCVIVITTYIPPSAAPDVACDVINSVTANLQNQHPNSFIIITGDFNHTSLDTTLPTFSQFVNCSTRDNKTLDLLYANIKDAYTSTALPPLGRSDHNLVLLTPVYTPIVQKQTVTTRTVRKWSQEAIETLQGCFEATDWNVFCDQHGDDINSMTDSVRVH
ncbi:uncharacterized protein LOC117152902 [Anabas testudineus]|uniref:uncharacterized protein LOC117152902 n=1 Tax=Anabas testudineus TaxID=64144 RepID=UPI00143D6FA3|nr:uncharacterized protein LOC117152902 [Anabas testudineus]